MEQNDIITKCEVTPTSSKKRTRKNNYSYKEQTECEVRAITYDSENDKIPSQLLNPTSGTMIPASLMKLQQYRKQNERKSQAKS